MDKVIKNKLDEILSLYDKDEYRGGGYSMTQYSHIMTPEDYIESRTDWNTLKIEQMICIICYLILKQLLNNVRSIWRGL